jgi:hypothetical protein
MIRPDPNVAVIPDLNIGQVKNWDAARLKLFQAFTTVAVITDLNLKLGQVKKQGCSKLSHGCIGRYMFLTALTIEYIKCRTV